MYINIDNTRQVLDDLGFNALAEYLEEYSYTEALRAIEEVRECTSDEEFTHEEYKQAIETIEAHYN